MLAHAKHALNGHMMVTSTEASVALVCCFALTKSNTSAVDFSDADTSKSYAIAIWSLAPVAVRLLMIGTPEAAGQAEYVGMCLFFVCCNSICLRELVKVHAKRSF